MKTKSINKIIEQFESLVPEEKEFAMSILLKAYADAKRVSILENAENAEQKLEKGNLKRGSVEDLYNDLEND